MSLRGDEVAVTQSCPGFGQCPDGVPAVPVAALTSQEDPVVGVPLLVVAGVAQDSQREVIQGSAMTWSASSVQSTVTAFSSALRRREIGTLLVTDLPSSVCEEAPLAPAVAKHGRSRRWRWRSSDNVIAEVHADVESLGNSPRTTAYFPSDRVSSTQPSMYTNPRHHTLQKTCAPEIVGRKRLTWAGLGLLSRRAGRTGRCRLVDQRRGRGRTWRRRGLQCGEGRG